MSHVIQLGIRRFTGPFMSPAWLPPKQPGLYAVMIPGWRLLMFHPVHFGYADDLSSPTLLKRHPKYGYWLTLAGSDWNLYLAVHEMRGSTQVQRRAAYDELIALPYAATRGPAHAQL
jgi:hypothetical protein